MIIKVNRKSRVKRVALHTVCMVAHKSQPDERNGDVGVVGVCYTISNTLTISKERPSLTR